MSTKKSSAAAAAAAAATPAAATPSPVDPAQVKSALLALYSHLSSASSAAPSKQLLEDEEDILLVVALKKIPLKQHNKPIRISIPHSLYNPATNAGSEICLFTKDPPQPADYDVKNGVPLENPIKTALQQHPVAGITKVLSITKLRKNYHQFADRRRLLAGYSLFLTDDRIMPLLPPLLGSKFYEKKKQPVAVNLAQHDLVKELTKARDSTYLYINTGACCTVRISRSSFSRQESFDNIQAALGQIAANVPKKWAGVQSLHIKTHNSIALPIYNSGHSIDQLIADPEPVKKVSSQKKKASTKKKPAKKRALSQKKEDKPATSAKKAKKEAKPADAAAAKPAAAKAASTKKAAAAAPAAAAAAATPAKAAKATGKRARDASPAPAAAASPAAKKAKAAPAAAAAAAVTTPVKAASTKANGASKSAVKAAATPKAASASQKKAPSTVASKKK